MKRRSHAKRRDANEPEIVEALLKLGAVVQRLDKPVDLLVGWHGATWLFEVKDGRKIPAHRPLTDAEAEFLDRWRGGPAKVVRCLEEVLCVMGVKCCPDSEQAAQEYLRQGKPAPKWLGCLCGDPNDDPYFLRSRRAQVTAQNRRKSSAK